MGNYRGLIPPILEATGVVQRVFRYSWLLGPWDGGLHSGSCEVAAVRQGESLNPKP